MKEPYLEVTFRHGRPFAAYYYLPRSGSDKSARTRRIEPGMIVDYSSDGRPIGIEITAPLHLSLDDFNRVLESLELPTVTDDDLAPLHAA